MSSKIINVVLVCLFTLCIAGKANAGLIVGDLYADDAGVQWEYVGSYDLIPSEIEFTLPTDVEILNGANTEISNFNGIEAAIYNFGTLMGDQEYAISTIDINIFVMLGLDISEYTVNHEAWYDIYGGAVNGVNVGVVSKDESYVEPNDFYNVDGAFSAYIGDRAVVGANINYVFKSVTTSVPEPSTLAIFTLALIGLTARRFKNK
ncbi:PEP-CTERM sorting domain-containing protein [Colwellia sp. 20A7]|uniref:PEP-CTERM sorting domain-containing protein n=1 Tax=Colwellia sp. 20A7 TaxID=2689569 RepID=UPI0013576E28|nr:PEP-CTERM sorting domain-containing protein [Colwellia sp. 20A7]